VFVSAFLSFARRINKNQDICTLKSCIEPLFSCHFATLWHASWLCYWAVQTLKTLGKSSSLQWNKNIKF